MDDWQRQQQQIIDREQRELEIRQIEELRREEREDQRPSSRDELVRRDLHREEELLHQRRQEQAHSQQGWLQRLLENMFHPGGRRRDNRRR